MYLRSMVKFQSQIIQWLISQELFYLTQVTRNNVGDFPISVPPRYPSKTIICCVVMLLTSYGMYQDHHTKTSKYGVWGFTLSMGMLQEIILIIDHIVHISWDMQLLQELLYIGSQTTLFLSVDPIIIGLMNIILIYPFNKITLPVIY